MEAGGRAGVKTYQLEMLFANDREPPNDRCARVINCHRALIEICSIVPRDDDVINRRAYALSGDRALGKIQGRRRRLPLDGELDGER